MKPPSFTYHRPDTVADALATLAEVAADGKVLAGGQSLVPLLNMRLAAPVHLVDVNRLAELAYVRTDADAVRVGALARHAEVERDAPAWEAVPLLRQALRTVAHPTIRNRGTTVGSIVHADPAGEMPAVLTLLGGSVVAASTAGRRTIPAAEFFVGPLESVLRPDELAVEAVFPRPGPRTGSAWLEVSRRHGDYAVCGVGVLVALDDDLRVASAKASYVSVGPTPVLIDLTDAVAGRRCAADGAVEGAVDATVAWADAGALAAGAFVPEPDIHASAAYRRHLVRVLTARAVAAAVAHAAERVEVPT